MRTQIKVDEIWIDGLPSENEWYREEVLQGVWQELRNVLPEILPELSSFTTNSELVTVNGNPTEGFKTTYFGVTGDSLSITFNIVDDLDAVQTQLDSTALGYPDVLSLPVLKIVNGDDNSVVDEVYFATTLALGVVTVSGSFPASGNWRLLTSRINEALAAISADWQISKDDVTFRINS